jgi:hypothetical protein
MRKARYGAVVALFAALLFLPHAARGLPATDDTPPIISYSIDGIAGTNDWFRGSTHGNNITLHWSVSDPESQIISTTGCDPAIQIPGPVPAPGTTRTCTATSDGGTTSITTRSLKIDADPPTTTATPSRPPNSAGWYRAPLSVSWSGVDPTSGIASCRVPVSYSGPDTAGSDQTGSCTDNAGNSSSDTFTVRYDTVAPTTVATPSRAANGAGWYRAPLSIAWVGSDMTSGLAACSATLPYSGPDTGGTPEVGSCTDNAGNSSSDTFTVRYDTQAPNTVATPARPPNGAGWYRSPVAISWGGTDALSGLDSCSTAVTYSGPDTTGVTRSGSCTDRAGNNSSDSVVLHYDATAPTGTTASAARTADHDGWYNHSLRIDWSGSDATSGIASCMSRTYGGPDNANATSSGNCTDAAGNTSTAVLGFQYDATGPAVTVSATRVPDHAGWYTRPVGISWSGTDATSGIDSCDPALTYSGPDRANASSVGGCTDHAGNRASPPALAFRYDATAPVTGVAPGRAPDANGWYNHALRVAWAGSDPVSGVASCTSLTYGGPDAGSVARTGGCTDHAGNASAPSTFRFRYDATAPGGLGVAPARPPDHDGWYNHPLAIRWLASDLLAGIASCTSLTYGGPDQTGGRLSGACTDRAGNRSTTLPFALRYDEEAPALTALSLKGLDDAVALRWRATGASEVQITRSAGSGNTATSDVYSGTGSAFTDRKVENYVRYRYTLSAEDPAGNTGRRTASVTPLPILYAPREGAHLRVHARPLFAWKPARKARYYNFQLWVDGRQIGSWWPARARLRLPARWSHDGERQRLERGTYTWYVWPGRGSRKLGRYGALLGKSSFGVG